MLRYSSVRFSSIVLLTLALSLSLFACGVDEGDVNISANLPLTGDLATYGVAVRDGANMALSDLDTLQEEGPALSVDWQDNQGSPSQAVSIFQRHRLGSPSIYVSGVRPQTMAIEEDVASEGTPHFVWIFDDVINRSGQNNNFRTWVSYGFEPSAYVSYAESINAESAAIVYVQLPHTVDPYEEILVSGLEEIGVNDIMIEAYDADQREFRSVAERIKRQDPDLIILNGFQSNLVGIVRSFRSRELIGDDNTIATYDMLDAASELSASELEAIRQVAPQFSVEPSDDMREWKSRFRERHGDDPIYTHAYAYDMMMIINEAASRLEEPGLADSQEWIGTLQSIEKNGVTGPLRFGDDGDLLTPLVIGVWRDGELVQSEVQVPIPVESPTPSEPAD